LGSDQLGKKVSERILEILQNKDVSR
jgi:hypothetical protein